MGNLSRIKINLLPPKVKERKRKRLLFSVLRISLIIGWTLVISFTAWLYYQYVYLEEVIKDKEKTFNALIAQIQREDLLKTYKDAENFVKYLRSFTSELLPIYEFLIALSSSIPDGVKLSKLESFKDRELRISGIASSPKAIAELLNAIKNIRVVQEVFLPSLDGEKGDELPFNFICRLREWW